jgi:hypothetical protein
MDYHFNKNSTTSKMHSVFVIHVNKSSKSARRTSCFRCLPPASSQFRSLVKCESEIELAISVGQCACAPQTSLRNSVVIWGILPSGVDIRRQNFCTAVATGDGVPSPEHGYGTSLQLGPQFTILHYHNTLACFSHPS